MRGYAPLSFLLPFGVLSCTLHIMEKKYRVVYADFGDIQREPLFVYVDTFEEAQAIVKDKGKRDLFVTGENPSDGVNKKYCAVEKWNDEEQDWVFANVDW